MNGKLMCPAQRWDSTTGEIENGTYFGQIAALTFKGPFEISGVSLWQRHLAYGNTQI